MKKTIIALSGIFVIAFFAVLLISAQTTDKDPKKPGKEVVKECPHSASQGVCQGHGAEKAVSCDPEKCADAGCDHANCTGNCTDNCTGQCKETATAKACNPAMCGRHAAAKK